ncbi:MAG: YtxH domain-containing protein [Armatimonadota bacterium]
MDNENKGMGFVFGVLVGSLVGAAVAILLTPHTGEDTRSLLKEKLEEGKSKAKEIAEDLKGDMEDIVEQGKRLFQEKKEKLMETISKHASKED